MRYKRKAIWIIAVILVILVLSISYFFYSPRPNLDAKKIDLVTSSYQITEDFTLDEKGSLTKYNQKVIEVRGKISEIHDNKEKGGTCLLEGFDFGGVMCEFEPGTTNKLKQCQVGDSITIKGKFSGYLTDVIINTCQIIKIR